MENGTEVPVMKVDKAGPNHGEFFMDTASISFERSLNSKRPQITVVWEKKNFGIKVYSTCVSF